MASGWLKHAVKHLNKPKESIIEKLRLNTSGPQKGRPRDVLHASDVTKPDFCPRYEAFLDMAGVLHGEGGYIPAALQVTFDVGKETERLIVEHWGDGYVIGNWKCRTCHVQHTLCKKPSTTAVDHKHHWEYMQWAAVSNEYGISGSVDSIWDLGTPLWMMAELKIISPTEFEGMIAPLPEHRLRTNLYLKIVGDSDSVYKGKINLHEGRVIYTSRAYGKKNDVHGGEILPWKEYVVERNDQDLFPILNRAKQLKVFRETQAMPAGICATAVDKMAKKCGKCIDCFSGQFPAQQEAL